MRRRTFIVLIIALLVVAALATAITRFVMRTRRSIENAYAVWNVAGMVIDHMESHDSQWPHNWDDLEAAWRREKGGEMAEVFARYRELVEVDFSADPKTLAQAPFQPGQKDPPFRVIRHRRHPPSIWTGAEPNELIWQYLNRPHPTTSEGSDAKAPRP